MIFILMFNILVIIIAKSNDLIYICLDMLLLFIAVRLELDDRIH